MGRESSSLSQGKGTDMGPKQVVPVIMLLTMLVILVETLPIGPFRGMVAITGFFVSLFFAVKFATYKERS